MLRMRKPTVVARMLDGNVSKGAIWDCPSLEKREQLKWFILNSAQGTTCVQFNMFNMLQPFQLVVCALAVYPDSVIQLSLTSPRYQITPNQYTVSRGKVQMQGSNHLCILIGSYQIMSRCTSEITLEYLQQHPIIESVEYLTCPTSNYSKSLRSCMQKPPNSRSSLTFPTHSLQPPFDH